MSIISKMGMPQPICGEDGEVYVSRCEMECHGVVNDQPGWKMGEACEPTPEGLDRMCMEDCQFGKKEPQV